VMQKLLTAFASFVEDDVQIFTDLPAW